MRRSASFVAALVAAGSIAGTDHASATIGSQAVTVLATDSPVHASSSGSVSPIRCWKTWQSVRDALLHHTTPAGCHKTHPRPNSR